MIYIALIRYASRESGIHGEFTFIVDACSQEDAELQLEKLLSEAVKNEKWFPVPCRILLSQLAAIESFPPLGGMILHLRRGYLDSFVSGFTLKHHPSDEVRILHDWDDGKILSRPVPLPLFLVRRDRSLIVSLPHESSNP
jgi:hypothetical protein